MTECKECAYRRGQFNTAMRFVHALVIYFIVAIVALGYLHDITTAQLAKCQRYGNQK